MADQQHYLGRVLRLREGDRFIAMDGVGHWWLCQLGADLTNAEIIQPLSAQTELPIAITLIAALPKGSGFDEVVRQATELGVSCIQPVISDRTLLKPSSNKVERWRRIAQESAEQSERLVIPTVLDPIPWTQALQTRALSDSAISELAGNPTPSQFIGVARGSLPQLQSCLQTSLADPSAAKTWAIAIGPEGGWTEAEVEAAIASGYQPVSLGARVLRAVTAPLVALAIMAAVIEANPTDRTDL